MSQVDKEEMSREESVLTQELRVYQINSSGGAQSKQRRYYYFAQYVVEFWNLLRWEVVDVKTLQKLKKALDKFRQENRTEILKMNIIAYLEASESKITVIRRACWGNIFLS